jgi:2-dehydro-3-deoxygluconokinase
MKLLCIGEVMIELSTALPFADALCFEKTYAGDAFNTAMAAQQLGTPTGFLTRLGTDVFSQDVLTLMRASGLHTDWIKQVPGKQMGLYLATYHTDGHLQDSWQAQYYRKNSVASTLHPDDLPFTHFFQAQAMGWQAVYATGISLAISATARDTAIKAFQQARKHKLLTCFDINYRPALWPRQEEAIDTIGRILAHTDVLTTSLHDVKLLLGLEQPGHILEYFHRKGVKWLVLRLGADGCLLGHVTGAHHHLQWLPDDAMPVKHPIGVGDAFNAGLLHALLQGQPLTDATRFAQRIAHLKLASPGTVLTDVSAVKTPPPPEPLLSALPPHQGEASFPLTAPVSVSGVCDHGLAPEQVIAVNPASVIPIRAA